MKNAFFRRFGIRAVLLPLVLLALSACDLRPVRVVQKHKFQTMCAQLRPEMQRRSLLDEQGRYLASWFDAWFAPALTEDYGRIFFQRLSPSFRYDAGDPMTAPESFAETAASEHDAEIRAYGFTLRQGLDTIDVDLIARSDWEGEGRKEWLLSCQVTFGGALKSRTYYLALPDLDAEGILTARVLAVFECIAHDCALHVPRAGALTYAPEAPVFESLPGRREIMSPPAHPFVPPATAAHKPKIPKKRVR